MFDNLSDKLQRVFKNLRGEGKLTEENMEAALREIRLALLEADVHFKVVRDFVATIRERAVGGVAPKATEHIKLSITGSQLWTIGLIAVLGTERFKGGSRVTFACGFRALRAFRVLRDAVAASTRVLSVLPEDLPDALRRVPERVRDPVGREGVALAGSG